MTCDQCDVVIMVLVLWHVISVMWLLWSWSYVTCDQCDVVIMVLVLCDMWSVWCGYYGPGLMWHVISVMWLLWSWSYVTCDQCDVVIMVLVLCDMWSVWCGYYGPCLMWHVISVMWDHRNTIQKKKIDIVSAEITKNLIPKTSNLSSKTILCRKKVELQNKLYKWLWDRIPFHKMRLQEQETKVLHMYINI